MLSDGNPNAPKKYITPDGYRLGQWQNSLRQAYIKSKLTPERRKRLEEIGFKM